MQAARQERGHARSLRAAPVWDDLPMTGSYLVARLHVDLQRVASAVCSAR
jgi:hypothetical protein